MATPAIYGLLDPRDGRLRYIGQALNPAGRLAAHIYSTTRASSHVACWIRKLLKLELRPEMIVLEEFHGLRGVALDEAMNASEIRLIALHRELGGDLTNHDPGGIAGPRGLKLSEEHRAKLSAAGKGRSKSPEHRAKIGASGKGKHPMTPEHQAKMIAGRDPANHYSMPMSKEHLAKMIAGRKPENKFSMKGYRHSDESRARMGAAHVGLKKSQETIEKIRRANTGRIFTAEHRAKLSEAARRRTPRRQHTQSM